MKYIFAVILPFSVFGQDTTKIPLSKFMINQIKAYQSEASAIEQNAKNKIIEIDRKYKHDLLLCVHQYGITPDSITEYILTETEIKVFTKKKTK